MGALTPTHKAGKNQQVLEGRPYIEGAIRNRQGRSSSTRLMARRRTRSRCAAPLWFACWRRNWSF